MPMHIVLSADDHYAAPLAVAMVSVLYSRAESDICVFHVLDGGIRAENRRKITYMTENLGAFVEFMNVSQDIFSCLELHIEATQHITMAAYYRLLLPSLLAMERCIYMDCDMICRSSLAPLWNTDLGGCLLGAVKDIDEDRHSLRLGLNRYFNSGLLLMDLAAMRKKGIQAQCFRFMEEQHERILMHDQDVLNCVLHGRICELDMTWNCQVTKTHKCRETGFYDLSKTAKILHFIGHKKPWLIDCNAPRRANYWIYLQKTPWKECFFQRIWHSFRKSI